MTLPLLRGIKTLSVFKKIVKITDFVGELSEVKKNTL